MFLRKKDSHEKICSITNNKVFYNANTVKATYCKNWFIPSVYHILNVPFVNKYMLI